MDATLEANDGRYILKIERRLGEPPEKVWRALTNRDLIKQWFPCDIEGDWTQGAELRFEFMQGEGEGLSEDDMRGEVLAVDEPRLLEFSWGTELIKYEITADGDGCLFRLSHTIDDPSWGARNAAGWEMCVENLDLLIEGVAFAKFAAKVWKTKFAKYVETFQERFGPQVGPPEDHPLLGENAQG